MPMYEFKCPKCSAKVERLFPNAEKDTPVACACGAKMGRIISKCHHEIKGYCYNNVVRAEKDALTPTPTAEMIQADAMGAL